MIITLGLDASEITVLQLQADANNAQPNRRIPMSAEDVALGELQPVADALILALKEKFGNDDRKAIIAALDDPKNVATAKAALKL